ncbi:MAG: hypothetical protein KF809_11490 [Chloroflexi bacterium]|nr:hypothetical protein [Chloroflexota bacterium]
MAGTGRPTSIALTEDPFGSGDPVELARLLRRALAAAGRKAFEVSALVLVTDADPGVEAVARFARRALGPHGAMVRRSVVVVARETSHEERITVAHHRSPDEGAIVIAVALGPEDRGTASIVADGAAYQRQPEHPDPFWREVEAWTDD